MILMFSISALPWHNWEYHQHRLEIESGRWIRTPIDNRKCSVCFLLEDEYHFVLECPLYSDLRKQYILKRYWKRPNMLKFIDLISSENTVMLRKLAIFIFKAFRNKKSYFVRYNLIYVHFYISIHISSPHVPVMETFMWSLS